MAVFRIKKEESIMVCIDVQTRLLPAMADSDMVVSAAIKLLKAADILDIPVLITQQYTKGLGDTAAEVKEAKLDFVHIEKDAFSVMGEPIFVEALKDSKRKNVIIFGIEAHVCVLQSVLDMIDAGWNVLLVCDGVSSRKAYDARYAIERALQAGAAATTVEAVLFELLDNDSKSEKFKAVSKLIK